jgi:hypothetical protein
VIPVGQCYQQQPTIVLLENQLASYLSILRPLFPSHHAKKNSDTRKFSKLPIPELSSKAVCRRNSPRDSITQESTVFTTSGTQPLSKTTRSVFKTLFVQTPHPNDRLSQLPLPSDQNETLYINFGSSQFLINFRTKGFSTCE